jgi:hypothetical protein
MRFDRTFWFLAFLFCASFVLGTIGFREHQDLPWRTAAYKAIQLFNTNSGALDEQPSPPPPILEFARWAALLFTLGAFAAVLASVFYGFRTWLTLKLRATFGMTHDIVCGAGEKGSALAADLLAKGGGVVVIDVQEDNPDLELLRKAGAMVIRGDARQVDTLSRAGIVNASRIVCAAGEDGVNLSIAMAVAKISRGRKAPLEVRVHISDLGHRDILERNKLLSAGTESGLEIKTFNFFRNKARQTLQDNPLELDNDGGLCDDVHVLFPGLGHFETALAVQSALIGHYRNGGKCTIHVVCENPDKEIAQLLKSYPNFDKCCRLQSHRLGSADLIPKAAEIIANFPPASFCTLFLCSGDSGVMFTEALLLKDLLPGNDRFRFVFSPPPDSYLREIVGKLSEQGAALSRWISFSRANSESCGQDAVFNESLDRLAKRIHQVWSDSQSAPKLWDQLPESDKDANRFAADHIAAKIRAIGLNPSELGNLRENWETLDSKTVEMLARVEHERWCAAKWIGGWSFGVEKDDRRRLHNCFVPFDQLTEEHKQNDRNQVKAAASHLIACTQAR